MEILDKFINELIDKIYNNDTLKNLTDFENEIKEEASQNNQTTNNKSIIKLEDIVKHTFKVGNITPKQPQLNPKAEISTLEIDDKKLLTQIENDNERFPDFLENLYDIKKRDV